MNEINERVLVMENDFVRTATASERIKEAMIIRGKKQIDLVNGTGIDKGSISSYISGRYEPKNEALCKIANVLSVNEMWLWGYDAPMERPQPTFKSGSAAKEQAEFDLMIAKDKDLKEMLKMYVALPEDKKKTVKQMIEDYYNAFA